MAENEWTWFRHSVGDALAHPRGFAARLPREHYGLAGVFIAVAAGVALSLTVDVAVIFSKGADPLALVTRLVTDAFLLAVRLTVVLALVALVASLAGRLARRGLTLDQAFTALSFATASLVFAPLVIVFMALAYELGHTARDVLLALAGLTGALIVLRVLVAVVLNIAALAGRATLVVATVALVASALVLQDQIGRVTFTALTYAPQLLPPPATTPATGQEVLLDDVRFSVPAEWKESSRGIPGVAAEYDLPDAKLVVQRKSVDVLTTADAFASAEVEAERRDFTTIESTERRLVRLDRAVAIDERWRGHIDETPVIEQIYTLVVGRRGYLFEFFYYTPANDRAAFDTAAAIAASITFTR